MKQVLAWIDCHVSQICWFLIGFFVYSAIDNFGRGNWMGVGINLLFAGMNYWIWRK